MCERSFPQDYPSDPRNAFTFNGLASACAGGSEWPSALQVQADMLNLGVMPDSVTGILGLFRRHFFSRSCFRSQQRGEQDISLEVRQCRDVSCHSQQWHRNVVLGACEKGAQWSAALSLCTSALEPSQATIRFNSALAALQSSQSRGHLLEAEQGNWRMTLSHP